MIDFLLSIFGPSINEDLLTLINVRSENCQIILNRTDVIECSYLTGFQDSGRKENFFIFSSDRVAEENINLSSTYTFVTKSLPEKVNITTKAYKIVKLHQQDAGVEVSEREAAYGFCVLEPNTAILCEMTSLDGRFFSAKANQLTHYD